MLHSDYVADLRAEIVKWCEGLQQVNNFDYKIYFLSFIYLYRMLKK